METRLSVAYAALQAAAAHVAGIVAAADKGVPWFRAGVVIGVAEVLATGWLRSSSVSWLSHAGC